MLWFDERFFGESKFFIFPRCIYASKSVSRNFWTKIKLILFWKMLLWFHETFSLKKFDGTFVHYIYFQMGCQFHESLCMLFWNTISMKFSSNSNGTILLWNSNLQFHYGWMFAINSFDLPVKVRAQGIFPSLPCPWPKYWA